MKRYKIKSCSIQICKNIKLRCCVTSLDHSQPIIQQNVIKTNKGVNPMKKYFLKLNERRRLIHISLASFYGTKANKIAPDVTPQQAASHLELFCLLT